MPRRRTPKHTPARNELVDRIVTAVLDAEIRHSSLWDEDRTREDEERNLRFRLAHADDVLATWTTASHDEVGLRLRIDGERLGRIDIKTAAGPRDVAWVLGDVLDLKVVLDAQADVTDLARRIIAREAGVDGPPLDHATPTRFDRTDPA